MRSALEFAHHEQKQGHAVCIREPSTDAILYGSNGKPDVHIIHSQLNQRTYTDGVPKLMMMHGEPLSSVGNRVSMKSILDLAPLCDAFVCMRQDEYTIWKSIKRSTYRVPKGVDLERYKPDASVTKLAGNPAILYAENWRGERNPLVLCVAMTIVHQRFPEARLHLYNCTDVKMFDTFSALWKGASWWPFLRTITGPADDVVGLYNSADIVVSCLYPLYARTAVEAMACGKGFVGPGYRENDYPYQCDLHPESMADAIIRLWEQRGQVDFRGWAQQYHDAAESTRQLIEICERFT
jgi:glycosyltransferase involved in cell wall biosynthesis